MADNNQKFQCTGNCLGCLPAQRAYCASQHAYSNMKVLDKMMEIMLGMQGEITDMKVKIEAIQNSEAVIFDPTATTEEEGVAEVNQDAEQAAPVEQTSVELLEKIE